MHKYNAESPKQGSRRFNYIVKTKYIDNLGIVNLWWLDFKPKRRVENAIHSSVEVNERHSLLFTDMNTVRCEKKYISTVMYSTVHAYVSVYHLRYKVPQKRVINFTYTKTTFRLIVFTEEWRHPKHECTEGREPCLILRGPLNGWLDLSVSFLCFYKSMYNCTGKSPAEKDSVTQPSTC